MAAEQIKLRTATVTDVPTIRQLAHDTWWPTYGAYIDHGQISLMLELIYSKNALRTQLAAGQCFALALRGDTAVGFVGFQHKEGHPKTMRSVTLYVGPSDQGNGQGKLLIKHVEQVDIATDCSHQE